MEVINDVDSFKRFLNENRKSLDSFVIQADEISEHDEWMLENEWDDIYDQEVKSIGKI